MEEGRLPRRAVNPSASSFDPWTAAAIPLEKAGYRLRERFVPGQRPYRCLSFFRFHGTGGPG